MDGEEKFNGRGYNVIQLHRVRQTGEGGQAARSAMNCLSKTQSPNRSLAGGCAVALRANRSPFPFPKVPKRALPDGLTMLCPYAQIAASQQGFSKAEYLLEARVAFA